MLKARTSKLQLCVYVFMIVSFNNCFSLITEQAVDLVRNFEGDYFANPEGSCIAKSCRVYNSSRSVGGYCYSTGDCCSQCRCPTYAPTYVLHLKQCMSLMMFVKEQIPDEIYYLLGNPATGCSQTCHDAGGNCVSQGHGFNDSKTTLSIFSKLNVNCKTSLDTDTYQYRDNPALAIEGDWKDRCIGFKNVNKTIHCMDGANNMIRRLCPCKGRYWLVENNCVLPLSKMSLLYLNTESYIRLKSCGLSHTQSLSNCVLEQIIYLQGSHWINFGKKEKDLFHVETVQGHTSVIELKWDKLGNQYDGIIGYIQIKCDLSGGIAKLSFVFKSNGSRKAHVPTAKPFVTTEAIKPSLVPTPTEAATPSSSTKAKGDFDKNKESNKGSSGAVVAGVTVPVVILILICVIVAVIFCKRRRKRKKSEVELAQSNPTYGKGPDNSLLLRQQDAKPAVNGKTMKAENTYEVPNDKNIGKKQGSVTTRAGKSNTYESVDPVNDSTYYYAKDVCKMANPQQDNHVYCTPVEDNHADDGHVYNVLAQPEQLTNHEGNGRETLAYNVLEREPVTEQGYNCKDDEGLYYCAN